MQIDKTTLADLEVFGSIGGAPGLFHLLDRTATTPGHAALRRRFLNPSADLGAIRRTQEAVRFFQKLPDLVTIPDSVISTVARYLGSNIANNSSSLLHARIEYVWMSIRYRDLASELRVGSRATGDLFARVARMCAALRKREPPEEVSELVEELAATVQVVVEACSRTSELLRLDRTLRVHHRARIERAIELVGELDALRSMASVTTSRGWVMPELVDSGAFVLDAEGLYHPFVEGAVTNPARLSGGEPMVFLTGPNMAGKTTYLRSVALVVLLGQIGMGVPARRARFTPVESLFTSLSPTDNLRAGLSYFLAEVIRVKAAATILADGRRALILFDEVFKGTNVKDALEATAEVILGFAKARRAGCIFSSHLAELSEVLRADPAIRFCYFDGDIVQGSPHYTYELREGVSDKRLGLYLLRQASVPELLARISA